jgi:hypothetical protein
VSTSRLLLYNEAVLRVGERQLSSLTEVREPRLILDNIWDTGAIDYCLEQGMWNFAMRTVKLDYSPSVEPPFGYSRAFNKPDDFIRVAGVCQDEFFNVPLTRYVDEAGYWFSDLDQIYVRYVSNDNAYGNDLSLWPRTFSTYVACYLAHRMALRLTQDETKKAQIEKDMKAALLDARSKAAMAEPTAFLPRGSWSSARNRQRGWGRDGGSRGGLIG